MSAPAVPPKGALPDTSRQVQDCADRIRHDTAASALWQRLRGSDDAGHDWPALAIRLARFRLLWPLQTLHDRDKQLNRLRDAIDAVEVAAHACQQAGSPTVPGPLAVLLGPETDWGDLPDAVLRRTPDPDLFNYLDLLRRHVGWRHHRLQCLQAATERLRTPTGHRTTALAPALIRWTVAILDEAGLPRHDRTTRRTFIALTARLAAVLSPDRDTQPGEKEVTALLRHDDRIRARLTGQQEPSWWPPPVLPDVSDPPRQIRKPEARAPACAARIRAADRLFGLFLRATAAQDDGRHAHDPVHRFATLAGSVAGLLMLPEHAQTRHATAARERLRDAFGHLQTAITDAAIPLPSPVQTIRRAALEQARQQARHAGLQAPVALHPHMAALLGPSLALAAPASRPRPAALLDPRVAARLDTAAPSVPTVHAYLHKLAVFLDDRCDGAAAAHPLIATPKGRWPGTDMATVCAALVKAMDTAGLPRHTPEKQAAYLDIAVLLLEHLRAAGLPEDWHHTRENLRKALSRN